MLTQPERLGPHRAAVRAAVVVPLIGAAIVALSASNDGLYRLLVKEDAILEWTQVALYGAAAAVAVAMVRNHRQDDNARAMVAVVMLAIVSLLAIGEELSWGQRILGFETPDLAAANRQGELTLHNDASAEQPVRLALLGAALYGTITPLLHRRHTPFVPPRALVGFFAVVVAYTTCRLLLLEHPSYTQAKYSEWPETCFAIALCAWCIDIKTNAGRSRGHARRPHGGGRRSS